MKECSFTATINKFHKNLSEINKVNRFFLKEKCTDRHKYEMKMKNRKFCEHATYWRWRQRRLSVGSISSSAMASRFLANKSRPHLRVY